MNIAYISPRFAPDVGGVETVVAQLATRVAAAGHHVEVLTQAHDRRLPRVDVIDAVTVRRFAVPAPSQHYAFAPGLWTYLTRAARRYDVLHAHNYHALPSLGAALMNRRPLVFSPHYHGSSQSSLRTLLHIPYRAAGAAVFRRASRVICVSEAEAALVRRHFPGASERLTVIPNGVDVAAISAAPPYAQDKAIVLSVGRLEEYKNVQRAIEALAHLDDAFALRVIGDGPARSALEALARRLCVQDRVKFLGRVDDDALRRWYRTARVYVNMSSHEAFGITLLEAIAAGAGVVAADIPAFRDVAAGSGALAATLIPLDTDAAALAHAIRAVDTRRGTRAAPPRVSSWDDVVAQTVQVYHAVAGSGLSCA